MKWFDPIVLVISSGVVLYSINRMIIEARRNANARFEKGRQEIARKRQQQINKESQREPGFLE